MASRWIDLSQPIYTGMPRTGLLDAPRFTPRQIDVGQPDVTVQITDCSLASHIGTHMDAPRHFFPRGKALDDYPVDTFTGPGVLLSAPKEPFGMISRADLISTGEEVRRGDIVLIRTGWGAKYGQPEYPSHPSLGEDAASWLVERGARIVGIDTITPEVAHSKRPAGYTFPIHRTLLGNGVLIIELLNLEGLRVSRMTVAAFPLPLKGGDGAPVRVAALVED